MVDKLNKRFKDTINFIKNNTGEELFGYPLLDQQLLTVYRLLHEEDRRFFLNYSDTGAGKTKAAIAVTYYAKAQHVLIICPCQVKDNAWSKSLEEINSDRAKKDKEPIDEETYEDQIEYAKSQVKRHFAQLKNYQRNMNELLSK